jgi:hypothetical protein
LEKIEIIENGIIIVENKNLEKIEIIENGVIIVENKNVAIILEKIINSIKDFKNIKTKIFFKGDEYLEYLVNYEKKNNEKKYNLIITNLDEAYDVPNSNFLIKFDFLKNLQEFCLSKSRFQTNNLYLFENDDTKKYFDDYFNNKLNFYKQMHDKENYKGFEKRFYYIKNINEYKFQNITFTLNNSKYYFEK